jgi:hypothetical protein
MCQIVARKRYSIYLFFPSCSFFHSFPPFSPILFKGAVVDSTDGRTSVLHHAAFGGHVTTLELLLSKSPNVNCRDAEKATPLHKAAFSGHIEAVRLLLKHGASVRKKERKKKKKKERRWRRR